MISHRSSYDNGITHIRVTLFIVMAGIYLVAGCMSPSGDSQSSVNRDVPFISAAITRTESPKVAEPAPAQYPPCLQTNVLHVTKGDPFVLSGQAPYLNISTVKIWIFGRNSVSITNMSVMNNGSFNFTVSGDGTKSFKSGINRIILQYPGTGDNFEINTRADDNQGGVFDREGHLLFRMESIRKNFIDGLEAAATLEREIMKPDIADTSTNATFIVEEPWIQINPVANHAAGDIFTVNGTTNLASGDEILMDFYPADYRPSENTRDFVPPTDYVREGICGNNTWSFDIDSGNFRQKEYIIRIGAVRQDAQASVSFFVLLPKNSENSSH